MTTMSGRLFFHFSFYPSHAFSIFINDRGTRTEIYPFKFVMDFWGYCMSCLVDKLTSAVIDSVARVCRICGYFSAAHVNMWTAPGSEQHPCEHVNSTWFTCSHELPRGTRISGKLVLAHMSCREHQTNPLVETIRGILYDATRKRVLSALSNSFLFPEYHPSRIPRLEVATVPPCLARALQILLTTS